MKETMREILGPFLFIPLYALLLCLGAKWFTKANLPYLTSLWIAFLGLVCFYAITLVVGFWLGTSRGLGVSGTKFYLFLVLIALGGIFGKLIKKENGYEIGFLNGLKISAFVMVSGVVIEIILKLAFDAAF